MTIKRSERRGWRFVYLALASLTGLLGLVLIILGIQLVALGGTFYYLACGALLVAGAVLAWMGRDPAALIVFGVALLLTFVWSLIEIGGKGWLPVWAIDFAGRVGLLSGLVIATGLAFLLWRTPPRAAPRRFALVGVLGAVAVVAIVLFMSWEKTETASAGASMSPPPTDA
jgi:quinoprotein glucose dehydrogenase